MRSRLVVSVLLAVSLISAVAIAASDRFQEQFRNSPLSSNIRVGDIPQNYRVQLSDPTKYEVVVSSFEGAPGVGRVQDQQKTLDKLFQVMNFVTFASVGGALSVASLLFDVTGVGGVAVVLSLPQPEAATVVAAKTLSRMMSLRLMVLCLSLSTLLACEKGLT